MVEVALRAECYLFHLGLGVLLVGMAVIFLAGPEATFTLGILPWQGQTLAWILLAAGLVAIAAVYLALRRARSLLLLIWSLAVLGVLVYGCFLSRFYFGREGASTALLLVAGATVAAVGSWLAFRPRDRTHALVGERF
jgi:hypothetical protein